MIVFSKKARIGLLFSVIYLGMLIAWLTIHSERANYWFANLFYDRSFILLLLPVFTIMSAMVDQSATPAAITRSTSRLAANAQQLMQHYIVAAIYLTIWTCMIILALKIKFLSVTLISLIKIGSWAIRYFLGLMIFVNIALTLRRTPYKIFNTAPYFLVYICLAVEQLIAIPFINRTFPVNIHLVFSWIFVATPFSYVALLGLFVITLHLEKQNIGQADIF